MARVNNLTNFLTDVASAIKTKKGSNTVIPAANFDTEILALPSQGVYQTKETNITTNGNYEITPDTNYDAMDKLRLNVNVPTPQLQTKSYTFTQNTTTTLTPDTNYDGFSSVDISINVPSGGSGDVKLFETEQAMQADPNPSEGDLAVVYRSEVQPCTATTHFSKAIFPETVVLDSALEDYVNLRFGPVDDSQMFYCWGMIDQSMFEMSCHREQGEYRIQYESQDGITYTRTTFRNPEGDVTGNELDFGVEIYYEEDEEIWNDVIGEFIQVGGSYFEGLYEYQLNLENKNYITFKPGKCLTVTSRTEGSYIYTDTVSIDPTVDIFHLTTYDLSDLAPMLQRIKTEQSLSGTDYFLVAEVNNSLIAYWGYGQNNPVFDANGTYLGIFMNSGSQTLNKYSIDLENDTYSLIGTETTVLLGNNSNHYGFTANTLGNKFSILVSYRGTSIYRC